MRSRIAWLLPGLALALLAGVVAADRLPLLRVHALPFAAGCALLTPLLARSPSGVAACALGLALCLGGARMAARLEDAARVPVTHAFDAAVEARVCDLRAGATWVGALLCDVEPVPLGRTPAPGPLPERLAWSEAAASDAGHWLGDRQPGERIRAFLRVSRPGGLRNPGSSTPEDELRRRGVGGRARLGDTRLAVSRRERPAPGARARVAARLRDAGRGGALLAALALGDRRGLPESDREALRALGISHLLAVSGLHLALVGGLVYAVVRRLGGRWPAWVEGRDVRLGAIGVAVLAGAAYAGLAGWGVPVRRALVFLIALAWVCALARRRASVHALAAAAVGVAFAEPAEVFGLGAQLSFCAAAALLSDAGAGGRGAAGLRVSATAIAATAPVLAGHGLGTSPFGLLANVAAVPWTAAVLLPGSLLASAEAWLLPGASLALPGLARIAEASLDAAGRIAGALPVAGASAPGAAGLALAVGLAALALRARRTLMRAALAAAVCGALSAAPPADVSPPAPRAVVLDVGLGDAVIVQGRRGALLVDGGWALPDGADLGRSVVVPALRALGVRRLDAAVATHADLDHRGGLGSVLRALPVGELWLPAGGGDDLAPLRAQAARLGIPVRELRRGDRVGPLGELEVEVLWPPEPTGIAPAASRNDASLVLRVETAGTRLLLTGDVGAATEAALLASGSPLRADVLKVAHHGSAGSSSAAFLAAVAPRWALVSAPCGGRLPSARTLARLQAAGAEVAWTGRDGALRVGLGARGPDVRSAPRRAGCQAP